MNELRQDKIHANRWVALAPKRAKRPHKGWKGKGCFFCPGNERLTPTEIFRVTEGGKWVARVFPNKFPAFSTRHPRAYGLHWIIVETPNHSTAFHELGSGHMTNVIEAYMEMMKRMLKTKGINCVLLFKNEGREAGMSSDHMHSQMIGMRKIFPSLEEELKTCEKYWKKHKRCIYCDLIKSERKSRRFVYENKDFVSFTPYAPVYSYATVIFPKKHIADFTKLNIDEIESLVDILKKVLKAVSTLGHGFNFYIHTSRKPYHHFHLEIRPRPNIHAGFELGSGIIINTITPEKSAEYLRGKIRKL